LGRVFLITLVLIIYGSLYPFQFHSHDLAGGPVWALLHSWPGEVDRFLLKDAVLNVLIYIPIGVFCSLWMGRGKINPICAGLTISLAFVLSTSIEIAQWFDATRTSSGLDAVTNVTGAALGVWLAQIYGHTLVRIWERTELRAVFRPSGALLLLCCWMGYQTFPIIPLLSHTQVLAKLSALWHVRSLSPVQTIGAMLDWLAVARLLELTGLGTMVRRILPLMMLVLPVRLLIVARSIGWPELVGAACAWVLWTQWLGRYPKRAALLAWAAGGMLLVRGLAPFQWQSTPTPFSWAPFAAVMDSGLLSGTIFFNKTFLYGTAIRLFADAGWPYSVSAIGVAGVLGAIEAIQTHLPGRTPEITDPLYALILGGVLRLLDSADLAQRQKDSTMIAR
jgi:VanZ family protein